MERSLLRALSAIALVATLLLMTSPVFAEVWSGDITSQVVWESNDTVVVDGGLNISSSGWLTIEEGAVILGWQQWAGSPSNNGVAYIVVEPGGRLGIGEANGDFVTVAGIASINLNQPEGTTLITRTNFTECGDQEGDAAFITVQGGEGDGIVFEDCNFNTILGTSVHWDEGSKGEVGTCGWQQWAGSPIVIGNSVNGGGTPDVTIIGNDFDGSTLGWQQWAGSPIISGDNGGSAMLIVIEDNNFENLGQEGVGVYFANLNHDDNLGSGLFDIRVSGNVFSESEIGIVVEGGAESNSLIFRNNVVFNCVTGVSVTSTEVAPALAVIANNTLFDNSTGIYASFDGDEIPDGLKILNNVAWESGVGYDFGFLNGSSLSDFSFRNNLAGECSVAGIRTNVTPATASIFHTGLKGNASNLKVGANDGPAGAFAGNCVFHTGVSPAFSLVNENPSSASWDFHLLVDDTWNDHYNNLVNSGWTSGWNDPDGFTADMGAFGGPHAGGNINVNRDIVANYTSVTTNEFFNNLSAWAPNVYRLNIQTPSLDMASNGTLSGGNATNRSVIEVPQNVTLIVDSNFDIQYATFCGVAGAEWGGFKLTTTTIIPYSGFTNVTVRDASYGFHLTGVDASGGYRLTIQDCIIQNCGVGVYGNNSRIALIGTSISGSDGASLGGAGVYLTGCAAGKVLIDGCTITGNGNGPNALSPAICLSSASPEIINTLVEDNNGSGISCYGSTPDLNTYETSIPGDRPNSIHSNGSDAQNGSNGSEVYLAAGSYPDIQFNNIWDHNGGPIGYMLYKHASSNGGALAAPHNWWGANPSANFFYWGGGNAIDFSNYSGNQLSSIGNFNAGMLLWDAGNFVGAAYYFRLCLLDGGPIGIKATHYLAGCYSEMENPNYNLLRAYYRAANFLNRDRDVSTVLRRFATDCLTQMGEYEEAMEEYAEEMEEANCVEDSVLAAVNWLAVFELANGDEGDALGHSIGSRMTEAFSALAGERADAAIALPEEFTIEAAYPNPFNSTTRIGYALPEASDVSITVHDLAGRQVASLFDGRLEAGRHTLVWNAEGVTAGVYFCKVTVAGNSQTTRMLLVK